MKYIVFTPNRLIVSYFDKMAEAKPVAQSHNGTVELNGCFNSKRLKHDFRTPEARKASILLGYC